MISPILSRRKWKLHAHEQHIVIVKGASEKITHPLMKAFLWALYMPQYPNISVEIRIGDKYKPDVVAFESDVGLREGTPTFWGEAGQVGAHKIRSIAKRYPTTHFATAKWDMNLDNFRDLVERKLKDLKRDAPFDLIRFPHDSAERFIDGDGNVSLSFDDVQLIRLES